MTITFLAERVQESVALRMCVCVSLRVTVGGAIPHATFSLPPWQKRLQSTAFQVGDPVTTRPNQTLTNHNCDHTTIGASQVVGHSQLGLFC